MEICTKGDGCYIGDTHKLCKINNPESYEKLNKHYLQYFIFPTSNIKSEFEFEGNSIDKQLFESYISSKSNTSRQPQENKHLPSTLTTTNIKEISLNGVVYVVED
jgi:hypothetical protein